MARNAAAFTASLLISALLWGLPAAAFETMARAAYVVDQTTGTVLMAKQETTPLPPASMSKLMTINMLFEALKDGRVTMDTEFRVSARASAMRGSTMFLREGERVAVRDLIPGMIVNSGNDACVTVAEALGGTEDAFARMMNERAARLGMKNSSFANASGWPDPNQRMSVEDLGILALRLISEFPEYYGFFGQKTFAFDNRAPANSHNRNPLLSLNIGADGLKTGHTQEAGYGLVGSARQGNRRVVLVITGLPSTEARAQEGERILNWAFRQFSRKTLIGAGVEVARAPVWLGARQSVGLVSPEALDILVPATMGDSLEATVEFSGPVEAPVDKGQELGRLVVQLPDMQEMSFPLVAAESVGAGGFATRLRAAARLLYARILGGEPAPG